MHARSTARHASAQGHRPPGRASHYPSGMDMAPKSARALPVERLASACEPELVPKPTPTNHMGFSYVNMAGPLSGLPPIMMILGQVSSLDRRGALATQEERPAAPPRAGA